MRAQSLGSLRDFFIIPGGEGHPPLWYWILRAMSLFTDLDHACWLAPGLAVLSCGLIASMLYDRPIALFAILFSVPFLWWAELFRPYELGIVFVLAATLCLRKRKLALCALFLVLSCFTHFFFFFLLPLFVGEEFLRYRTVTILKGIALPSLIAFGTILLSARGNDAGRFKTYIDPSNLLSIVTKGFGIFPSLQLTEGWLLLVTAIPLLCIMFVFGRNLYTAIVTASVLSLAAFLTWIFVSSTAQAFLLSLIVVVGVLIRSPDIRWEPLLVLLYLSDVTGVANAQHGMTKKMSNSVTTYEYIRAAHLTELPLLAVSDELLSPAAYKYRFRYYSLPMARETDGLIDWSQHHYSKQQFQHGYTVAGCPKLFLLAYDRAWQEQPVPPETVPLAEICNKMGWECRLIHSDSGALYDNIDLYRVRPANKSSACSPGIAATPPPDGRE